MKTLKGTAVTKVKSSNKFTRTRDGGMHLVSQAIEVREDLHGDCPEELAQKLRGTTRERLEVYIEKLGKRSDEKRGKEQLAMEAALKKDGVKAACVRCGAEEAIDSRRDWQGPKSADDRGRGFVRSLGWSCGGCGGDECTVKEVKEMVAKAAGAATSGTGGAIESEAQN